MKQISFETAALAYKKNFKLGSFAAYNIDGNITSPLEWLRSKHKCFVVVSPKFYDKVAVWKVRVIFDACNSLDNNGDFLSYEDALEFGLKLALDYI